MKLIFLLQRNSYFIEHNQAWYRLQNEDEIALALSTLPISVADEFDIIEQPHQRGSASIKTVKDDAIKIDFMLPDQQLEDSIEYPIDGRCLAHVEWQNRRYNDGWTNAHSVLNIDGISSYVLHAYLPAMEGSTGKTLTITNETEDQSFEVFIKRDDLTIIPLVEASYEGKRKLTLRCEPEKVNSSTDIRQLGFILVEESVAAA